MNDSFGQAIIIVALVVIVIVMTGIGIYRFLHSLTFEQGENWQSAFLSPYLMALLAGFGLLFLQQPFSSGTTYSVTCNLPNNAECPQLLSEPSSWQLTLGKGLLVAAILMIITAVLRKIAQNKTPPLK